MWPPARCQCGGEDLNRKNSHNFVGWWACTTPLATIGVRVKVVGVTDFLSPNAEGFTAWLRAVSTTERSDEGPLKLHVNLRSWTKETKKDDEPEEYTMEFPTIQHLLTADYLGGECVPCV